MEQENTELLEALEAANAVEESEGVDYTQSYEESGSTLTEDDYYKEVSRREKAEKALVELKKKLKNQPKSDNVDIASIVRGELEQEKFFSKNEDAVPYRDKILEYKAKGLSLDEAYILASRADKEIENNRVYSDANLRGRTQTTEGLTLLTIGEFDRLNSKAQQEYIENCKTKKGKVTFK